MDPGSGLVQTLFYGLFATWVLTARESTERFNWRTVSYDLRLPPIIHTLFENFAKSSNVKGLGIVADLDRAGDALDRVNHDRFFEQFEHGTAIEYFYEPFLDAYDPDLRAALGVWYTPRPVVDFIVEEVDRRLRTDFGRPLGLADESVVVLDPATGTGTFLSACVRRISRTLLGYDPDNPGDGHDPATVDGLAAADVRTAATTRLFGFELLPAPFVIAHLRLGLTLQQLGVPLPDGERAAVYLTNSLTGWDPDADPPDTLFEALNAERDSASAIKRDETVLVILGNPPYNAYAGVGAGVEETELIAPYKVGIRGRHSLDDLYVRFFRVAERRVAEMTGQGIVAYITNRSYLRKPSFRTMRQHLLSSFDTIDVTDLNGDRDETGKRTPSGRPDPSVFTSSTSGGIAEGTAIAVLARHPDRRMDAPAAAVTYRSVWGRTKADDLTRISEDQEPQDPETDRTAHDVHPSADNFHAFQPVVVGAGYYDWISLPELTELPPEYGLHEARGGGLIAVDRQTLEGRMAAYLDPAVPDADLPASCAPLLQQWSGFQPTATRQRLTGQGPAGSTATRRPYDPAKILPYLAGPLDKRYAYVEVDHNLWVAPQRRLAAAHQMGAWFLYAQRTVESDRPGLPIFASRFVGDQHVLHKTAFLVPNRLPADPPPADGVLPSTSNRRDRPAPTSPTGALATSRGSALTRSTRTTRTCCSCTSSRSSTPPCTASSTATPCVSSTPASCSPLTSSSSGPPPPSAAASRTSSTRTRRCRPVRCSTGSEFFGTPNGDRPRGRRPRGDRHLGRRAGAGGDATRRAVLDHDLDPGRPVWRRRAGGRARARRRRRAGAARRRHDRGPPERRSAAGTRPVAGLAGGLRRPQRDQEVALLPDQDRPRQGPHHRGGEAPDPHDPFRRGTAPARPRPRPQLHRDRHRAGRVTNNALAGPPPGWALRRRPLREWTLTVVDIGGSSWASARSRPVRATALTHLQAAVPGPQPYWAAPAHTPHIRSRALVRAPPT